MPARGRRQPGTTRGARGAAKAKPTPRPHRSRTTRLVLLTGPTSSIGRRLVPRLATREGMDLLLLAPPDGGPRVEALLASLSTSIARRIEILEGNVIDPDLGLPLATASRLRGRLVEVWHLAAPQALEGPLDDFWRLDVQGTRNVVSFAEHARHRPRFVHNGTVFVSGDRTGRIMEDESDHGQSFRNPYEESRFYAERAVRMAADKTPTTVLRNGFLVDPESDRLGGLQLTLRWLARLERHGMVSPLPRVIPTDAAGTLAPLPFSPSDYVAEAAYILGTTPDGIGIFHLVDPKAPDLRKTVAAVQRAFRIRGSDWPLPASFLRTVLAIGPLARRIGISPSVADVLLRPAVYDTTRARAILRRSGVRCPSFRVYLDALVRRARKLAETESS